MGNITPILPITPLLPMVSAHSGDKRDHGPAYRQHERIKWHAIARVIGGLHAGLPNIAEQNHSNNKGVHSPLGQFTAGSSGTHRALTG